MKFWNVELAGGNMTIVKAMTIEDAKRWAMEEFGRYMSPRVSEATEDDVAWTKAMGGTIHEALPYWRKEQPSRDDMIRSNEEGFTLSDLER